MSDEKLECWNILYRSVYSNDETDVINSVWQILSVSARNNLRDKITGLLVYDRGRFFQVLEGSFENVNSCYKRIGTDSRHDRLEVLIDQPVAIRTFGRWAMGFVDAFELEDYLSLQSGLHSDHPSEVYDTMVLIGREHGLIQRATS